LENPGGLKTERLDVDYPEGAPKFVQQDNIDGHHHRPEARTRRLADPPDPRLCGEQLRVGDLVAWGENVFYTGGAGAGKSTVLRAIVRELREQGRRAQVVTPTGISALNVGGSTYFTWAGWTPWVTKKSIVEIENMAMSKERRQRIKDTDVLIIDEISMLESKKERDGYGNLVGCQDHRFPPLLETKLGMPVILLADNYDIPHVYDVHFTEKIFRY
jgi:hypothetical protein